MLPAIASYQQYLSTLKEDFKFSSLLSFCAWERLNEQAKRFISPLEQRYVSAVLDRAPISDRVERLKPWRKGPYIFDDFELDAEWRCNLKWDRVMALGVDISGKTVLDLGCGNGYYMFRMLEKHPTLVCGLDPSALYFFQFQLALQFNPNNVLYFLPLGWQDLDVFSKRFDTLFCMGVLYHHRDPVALLKQCGQNMAKGGELVLETLVIEGDDLTALTPHPQRYACMPNVFIIPTVSLLKQWLNDSGFSNSRFGEVVATSDDEQRVTPWGPKKSVMDFLDPQDMTKTLEGFPAPKRVVCVARLS